MQVNNLTEFPTTIRFIRSRGLFPTDHQAYMAAREIPNKFPNHKVRIATQYEMGFVPVTRTRLLDLLHNAVLANPFEVFYFWFELKVELINNNS